MMAGYVALAPVPRGLTIRGLTDAHRGHTWRYARRAEAEQLLLRDRAQEIACHWLKPKAGRKECRDVPTPSAVGPVTAFTLPNGISWLGESPAERRVVAVGIIRTPYSRVKILNENSTEHSHAIS